MNLWTYWEGPRNPFIDTCLASMEAVCTDGTEFHLVTPTNASSYLDDWLHPNYLEITSTHGCNPAAMRAGAIRVALLARYGGMYWDADTIGLRNPAELVSQYEGIPLANLNLKHRPVVDVLYTTWDRPPTRVLNGYIYMRKGCYEAMEWLGRVNKRLETQRENPVVWTELGEQLLTPIVMESATAWRVPRETFLPIDVDSNVEEFFDHWQTRFTECPEAVCFGMNQSYFMHHHRKEMELSPDKWRESPLLIHRLLEMAREA
jgi:hypothetical protein